MPGIVVIGSQFGDEGKGKVTDFLSDKADIVVRYQGGNNAGHTVVVNGETLKFHLLPSGVVQGKRILIGAGVVLDPRVLKQELNDLGDRKIDLGIDPRTHIIMPWHNLLDEGREEKRSSKTKIGTTKRGIGPAYADKAERIGIRFEDLVDKNRLAEKIREVFPVKKAILEKVYNMKVPFDESSVLEEYSKLGELFRPMLSDVSLEVTSAIDSKNIVFEGAQGVFLDNDFGTYPFVTSSHPISGGVSIGVGMPLNKIERIIGIVKAYTTRVGFGPFPTELKEEVGKHLTEKGNEFGTTTGRQRRVGWLDLPMLRTSMRINGFTELAITKLDVLSGLDKVKICKSYTVGEKEIMFFPYSNKGIENAVANYEEFEGFEISGKERNIEDLNEKARTYLDFIEKEIGAPIKLVSVGPGREETIRK